ncbi:FimV/HubP family polar landmark protein [Acidithiobacillus sp.]
MMDKKNWLWALAGMGLLLPGMAQALGLGDLRVLSAPGEPFRAEISIQSLSPQSEASIRAGLAPASAFAMINLPKAGALDHWHFTVRSGDRPAILISSPLPLPQPALHFLVQLNWSGGQLVREYSASSAGDNVVSTPRTMTPVPQSSTSPTMPQPVRHAAPAPIYHGWSRVSRYGPVPVNGSLFQVAQYITRSSAVTLDQVMAALVKANPQAFKGGNPAYLYAGSMLTVPSLAQVQAASPAQAKVWLSAQRAGSGMSVVATAPTAITVIPSGTVTAPAASAVAAAKSAGNATHLVLSSAPAAVATAVAASTASAATTGQLQVPDAVLRDDNQKLMAEVASLGQRLSAEERLLASQGAQLATLSRTAGNSSLFNDIPLVVSLGGNILLLILFLWMLRRQKEAERRQREISQRLSTLSAVPRRSGTQPPEPVVTLATPVAPVPAGVQSAVVGVPVFDVLPGLAPSADHPESAKDAYTGAEIDPIEQADLYLTYGKAVQAVTVLNEALEENPRRKELYVKLLDIYANLDRHEEYLDLAERMRGRFGPHNAAWQEVAAQGTRLFPGNVLFATSEDEAATATTPEPVTEVSLPEPVEKSVAPAPLDMLDFHFDQAPAEPATVEEESVFPPEEKARLLQDIDEQFRLMDETREESPAALEAPVAAPLFGLTQHDEPSTPALPASHSAAAESPAAGEPSVSMDVADWDAVGTKLDLAKAYVEMGDSESARDLLEEVTREGSSAQQEEARQLLKSC